MDAVEDHWPHVAALHAMLKDIGGGNISAGVSLANGGDTFHIYTTDPMRTAAEVVRAKRTAAWLMA